MLARAVLGQQGRGAPIVGWVSSTEQGSMSNSTSHVVTLPARVSGDILVATLVDVGSSSGWTTPSGWTLAADQNLSAGLDIRMALYYRTTDAAEGASVTFTNGASSRWIGVCDLYRGFSSATAHSPADIPTSDFAASATLAEWTGTPPSADAGDLLVSVFGISTNTGAAALPTDTFTQPTGTSVRSDHRVTNGANRAGAIIVADRVAVGSDTAGVWTAGGSNATHDKAATAVLVLNA
jgi:hypothetical protein